MEEVKLNTKNWKNKLSEDYDPNNSDQRIFGKIMEYMDGEIAYVYRSGYTDGYAFCGLKDQEKNKEVRYMMEQDSMVGRYIDDREAFDRDWESDKYEPDGCFYLDDEDVILTEQIHKG